MEYYKEDLLELINNNRECNFIACGITGLHSIGINATIHWMHEEGMVLNGYILMQAHSVTGRVLKADDFNLHSANIKCINYVHEYKYKSKRSISGRLLALKHSLKKTSKKLFILLTEIDYSWYEMFSRVNEQYTLFFVRIDDGGRSYANIFADTFQYEMYINPKTLQNKIFFYIKIKIICLFNIVLEKIAVKNDNYLDNRIFSNIKGKNYSFKINKRMIPYYQSAFKNSIYDVSNTLIEKLENSILINSQCLEENKITNGILDFEIYSRVAELAYDLSIPVVFKPHPRELNIEKYKKLKVYLISENVSQEILLAKLTYKPKCIISIFSSTLLNAYGIFQIPAISLAKIVLKEDINQTFRKQLLDYIVQYDNIFYFPENFQDLKEILEKL